MEPTDPALIELHERYMRAAHAMQTGVAYMDHYDPKPMTAKHLRVGVNTAHSDLGALVRLLISKGVLTELEYMAAIVEAMEDEVASYEAALMQATGGLTKIALK
jgi:hypothetical protein